MIIEKTITMLLGTLIDFSITQLLAELFFVESSAKIRRLMFYMLLFVKLKVIRMRLIKNAPYASMRGIFFCSVSLFIHSNPVEDECKL